MENNESILGSDSQWHDNPARE